MIVRWFRRSLLGRLLRRTWRVARWLVLLVGLVLLLITLAMELDVTKRWAVSTLNDALAETFEGRIVIERIGELGWGGLNGATARVEDAGGERLIYADGVAAQWELAPLLWSLSTGRKLDIRINEIRVDYVDVDLRAGHEAPLALIEALRPRASEQPAEGANVALLLKLADIKLGHVWAHGAPAQLTHIDADVDEVDASLLLDQGKLGLTLRSAQLNSRQMPHNADLAGSFTGNLKHSDEGLEISGRYIGTVAAISADVEGSLAGDTIDVTLAIQDATAERMRQVLPSWPLTQTLAVAASAHGTTAMLRWQADLQLPHGHLTGKGSLQLSPQLVVAARLAGQQLDLSELLADLPESRLAFGATVNVRFDAEGYPLGTLRLELAPSSVLSFQLPAATFSARANDNGYQAELRSSAPLTLDASLSVDRARSKAEGRLHASIDDIGQLEKLGIPVGALRGRAATQFWGEIGLGERPRLRLSGDLNASRVSRGDVAANHLSATIAASGPLLSPQLKIIANGVGLSVAGQQLQTARVQVSGTPQRVQLLSDVSSATLGEFEFHGGVELAATASEQQQMGRALVRVSAPRLTWSRKGQQLGLLARRIVLLPDEVVLDGARLEGLGGAVFLQGTLRGEQLNARLDAQQVELSKVAALAGIAGDWNGHAALSIDLHGSDATIKLNAEQDGLGQLAIDTSDLRLAGPSLRPSAWQDAAGAVTVHGDVLLAALAQQLAHYGITWPALDGDSAFSLRMERERFGQSPQLSYLLKLQNGAIAGYREVSAELSGGLREGALGVQGSVRLGKRPPLLLAALVELPRPPRTVEELTSLANWKLARLRSSVWLRPQSIEGLLNQDEGDPAVRGEVELLVNGFGTLGNPKLAVDGRGRQLAVPGVRVPLFVHLRGGYDGRRVRATLAAEAGGRALAVVTATTQLPVETLWAGKLGEFKVGVQGAVNQLPAQWITALDEYRLGGTVSATFALDDYLSDAGLTLRAGVTNLSVEGARQGDVDVRLLARANKITIDGSLTNGKSGLDLTAHGPIQWGAALLPQVDKTGMELSVVAKRFRLAAIAPLLSQSVKLLDGNLDGKLVLRAGKDGPRAEGDLLWTHGRLQLRGFGERLEPVVARVTADGKGGFYLRRFEAKSLGGSVEASGQLELAGLSIKSASAKVHIPDDEPLPLVLDGVSQGHISGRFDLTAARSGPDSPLDLRVSVPQLSAELPQRSRRDVQALDPPEHIRIGRQDAAGNKVVMFPLAQETAAVVASAPDRPATIRLDLGNNVEVRQGDLLRVQLGGSVSFRLSEPLAASGTITLNGGTLDIKGKSFLIQQGTVTFTDDVTNPQINVTAAWTAANGTIVYADYVGPVKEGKLTLRSQPSLSRGEILALLLFGTSDRNINAVPGSSAAVSLAGDVATQPLNQALRDITGLDIATRIDTTRSDNPAPEVELRIARSLSLQFTHILGLPTPGENPDRNLTTLVWRFLGNWSVETTVGDQGSAVLDLFWRYSY